MNRNHRKNTLLHDISSRLRKSFSGPPSALVSTAYLKARIRNLCTPQLYWWRSQNNCTRTNVLAQMYLLYSNCTLSEWWVNGKVGTTRTEVGNAPIAVHPDLFYQFSIVQGEVRRQCDTHHEDEPGTERFTSAMYCTWRTSHIGYRRTIENRWRFHPQFTTVVHAQRAKRNETKQRLIEFAELFWCPVSAHNPLFIRNMIRPAPLRPLLLLRNRLLHTS